MVDDDAKMFFGRIWDDVTGVWWEYGLEGAVEWLFDRADRIDQVEAAKIAALLKNYNPPRDRFKFLGNQVKAEIRPKGMYGVKVLCIADTLLEDVETGEKIVRECKTTSRDITGYGPYWQRLQVDGQLGAYYHAFGVERMFYDVTGRPGIKCCGKDERAAGPGASRQQVVDAYQARLELAIEDNPAKWHAWRAVEKTDADADEAMDDIVERARMLRESWKNTWFPRNSNQCMGVYGVCRFLDVCTGRASLQNNSLFRDYKRRK